MPAALPLLAAGLFAVAPAENAAAPAPRYNVLFIAVDDLNDWLGAYRAHRGGHPGTKTPNFDRLAAESLLFTNAHCAHPVCNPSRTALLTGMSGTTTGVYGNATFFRYVPGFEDAVTLPQHFRQHGYRTVSGGKIHHGARGPLSDPVAWDEQFTETGGGAGAPPEAERMTHGLQKHLQQDSYHRRALDWAPTDHELERTGDYRVCDWFADRLERPAQPADEPFFHACGIFRPHLPWYMPREFFDRHPLDEVALPVVSKNDRDDLPEPALNWANPDVDDALTAEDKRAEAVRGYLASVSYADACLGRLLDGLGAGPHKDRTIVVLWGDHGWHLGQKKAWGKVKPWERTTRVPLMIRVPGLTTDLPAGAHCDAAVSLLDLYPTLADLCGLPPNPACEGRSLTPLLRDPATDWPHAAVTVVGNDVVSVRGRRYRLIRYPGGAEEFYDHAADPREWTNLLAPDAVPLSPDQDAARDRLAGSIPKSIAEPVVIESRPNYLKASGKNAPGKKK